MIPSPCIQMESPDHREQALQHFHWSKDTLAMLKCRGDRSVDWKIKARNAECYFFELLLELCLAPRDVLSDAPGFEGLIGYRGGGHRVQRDV